jgi:hypothetical protein
MMMVKNLIAVLFVALTCGTALAAGPRLESVILESSERGTLEVVFHADATLDVFREVKGDWKHDSGRWWFRLGGGGWCFIFDHWLPGRRYCHEG